MEFNNLDITIKDYIGLIEKGIGVIVTIKYEEAIFEGLFWYDNNHHLLTIDDSLEEKIGPIKQMETYASMLEFLKNSVPPFDELRNTLPIIR